MPSGSLPTNPPPLLLLLLASLLLPRPLPASALSSVLPPGAFHAIQRGGVVVVPNFLPPAELAALRADASALHRDGTFIVDGLANYAKKREYREPPATPKPPP